MSMTRDECGVTLTELLVASVVATVLIIGIGSFEGARVRIAREVERAASTETPERMRTGLAAMHLTKRLENADRVVLGNSGGTLLSPTNTDLLIRTPVLANNCPVASPPACPTVCIGCTPTGNSPACCFDIPANYRWDEYRLCATGPCTSTSADQVKFYSNLPPPPTPCSVSPAILAKSVRSFLIDYTDNPDTALGTQPTGLNLTTPEDSNVLDFALEWSANGANQIFPGRVTLRSTAYTNVATGLANPGGADIRPPPVSCSP